VHLPPSNSPMKSDVASCYMCCSTSPEVEPYKQEFIREFWTASRLPEPHEIDTLISQGAGPQRRDFISFARKAQTDLSNSSELCAVACGCELRARSLIYRL
jgi:hypothetical protein